MPPPDPKRLINRELSWLSFNQRVLDLARDPATPLLERTKFLAIASRNLDEFFQVRVADLQDRRAEDPQWSSPDGRTAEQQLEAIREAVEQMSSAAYALYRGELVPALAGEGIELLTWQDLDVEERGRVETIFDAEIRPTLIPLAVDSAHPFPYVSALSLSIGAIVGRPGAAAERFARIKVPSFAPRLFEVSLNRMIPIEEVIIAILPSFFPEDEIRDLGCFRVTRDADLELRERDDTDLASEIEVGLRRMRRQSDAVRLEVSTDTGPKIREMLMAVLQLKSEDVYDAAGPLDLGSLWDLSEIDRPDLKYDKRTPRPFRSGSSSEGSPIFDVLLDRDCLVHHPYQSFESSLEELLSAAAEDPKVRVIMCTIYRTGGPESGIVRALEGAAAAGKQVVVLVELKARFDEAANLQRARSLERAGAHVVYGVMGLKTHSKIALVVRAEPSGLRRYCHVGTGNYNPVTARIYEDIGLLTSDPEITRDVAEVFHRLTSGSGLRDYDRLLVAPEHLREGIIEKIQSQSGPGGRIVLKANSLADPPVIDALYAASQAGCEIDLIIRGICCLRPGVHGLSERIRVHSILGRYLEHSRIFRFGSPTDHAEYWLGSADLMPRNLDLRVETVVPIRDEALRGRIDRILSIYLQEDIRHWELSPDGSWKQSGGTRHVQDLLSDWLRHSES
ncbi:MAG: polyphosphate kinase 1 [Myxococcota bacterium]|nr:polyphosphate kinase 1 [Myxococcota bacterium]